MNGATALPWVSRMSPPKSAIMIRMGSNQNFFRTRTKAHSSRTKSTLPSELPPHGVRGRPRRPPGDPVARGRAIEGDLERGLAEEPHEEPDGRDREVEEEPEDDRARDALQKEPKAGPPAVERGQRGGSDHGQDDEDGAHRQRPR